ncbi:hypothetical protein SRHO_G00302800 [Serrasalmus rhombeus]
MFSHFECAYRVRAQSCISPFTCERPTLGQREITRDETLRTHITRLCPAGILHDELEGYFQPRLPAEAPGSGPAVGHIGTSRSGQAWTKPDCLDESGNAWMLFKKLHPTPCSTPSRGRYKTANKAIVILDGAGLPGLRLFSESRPKVVELRVLRLFDCLGGQTDQIQLVETNHKA